MAFFCTPVFAALVLNNLDDYTNNFDHFATNSLQINHWTNDQESESSSGSPGWYWQDGSASFAYQAGLANSPGPYSLGDSANPGDRAMGSYSDESHLNTAWGIVFQNKTGQTISQVDVRYLGEQWRRAGLDASTDRLYFSSRSSAKEIRDLLPAMGAVPTDWTSDANLTLTAMLPEGTPTFFGTPGSQLKRGTLDVHVPNGHFLALRWFDTDVEGDDAALGIDDLTVGFTVVAVPEPSAFLFGGLVCCVWLFATHFRKRHDTGGRPC